MYTISMIIRFLVLASVASIGTADTIASETTFSSTNTATTTSLPALTTPFIQPPECTSIWDITTTLETINFPFGRPNSTRSTVTRTLLVSDPADERFSTCQPPGWDTGGRFSFSPGVCPSQWTYHQMATETYGIHNYTRSTAFCCASGFDLSLSRNFSDRDNFTASCTRTLTRGETLTGTLSHGKGPQALFTAGIQAHQAWAISWSESDTAKMSPSLPNLTNVFVVPTWVPGETIPASLYEGGSDASDMGNWQPLVHFFMIGIPIIGVAILALGIWCCIRCGRARREERQQRGVLAQPQEIDTTAPPPYSK